jgi:hypothetical protein
MEYLSTTKLAEELDYDTSELFNILQSLGWIERSNNKWILTDAGKSQGGQIRSNSNYGEYIVWPEDIKIPDEDELDDLESEEYEVYQKRLNSTQIGKHFNVSPQRMNLILAELGWIEKNIAGWDVTKLGNSIGGQRFEATQGFTYVIWPENILQNRNLINVFNKVTPAEETQPKQKPEASPISENFRHKYPATIRTQDGHFVRSKSEAIIDNWLYISGLVHSYEKKLPIDEDIVSDFYIPSGNGRPQSVYIEYWGLENDSVYKEKMIRKIEIYKKYELPLIELYDKDIENIDDVLTKKLLAHKIKVGG